MDCSPPGSSVHGIFQARVLEWVTIAFSGDSVWDVSYEQEQHSMPGGTYTQGQGGQLDQEKQAVIKYRPRLSQPRQQWPRASWVTLASRLWPLTLQPLTRKQRYSYFALLFSFKASLNEFILSHVFKYHSNLYAESPNMCLKPRHLFRTSDLHIQLLVFCNQCPRDTSSAIHLICCILP